MTDAFKALCNRFGEENITRIEEFTDYSIEIVLVKPNLNRDFSILMTLGLSAYEMPVNELEQNEPFIELCFALPSYWDLKFKSTNARWVLDKLKFLVDFCLSNETYFWNGHTMPNAKPDAPFSTTMKMEFLFFSQPMLYENELATISYENKTLHLLFLVPIFRKELEHKFSRGTLALKKKLVSKNHGEILDDFRVSTVKPWLGLF
jgi:hypothetical protein